MELLFEYCFQSTNAKEKEAHYFTDVKIDIYTPGNTDGGTDIDMLLCGQAELTIINTPLIIQDGADVWEECDDQSLELRWFADVFFNENKGALENSEFELDYYEMSPVVYARRLIVFPEFRGKGITKDVFDELKRQYNNSCFIAGKPFPLQFENERIRLPELVLGKHDEGITLEQAKKKIERHYIKCGCKKFDCLPGWLLLIPE